MESARIGLQVRALRRRRAWTQPELGLRARVSRSSVSRIERGDGDRIPICTLDRIADALGARVTVRLSWQGEELDRLLDSSHAQLVEVVLTRLGATGWDAEPEVTFQIRAERGAIDIFARHRQTDALLVVEVKLVVPDIQAMLAGVDRKARLAPVIARERGWEPRSVSRLLVLPHDRTARRRLEAFDTTFGRAFPARTLEVRRRLLRAGRPAVAAPERA